MKAWMSAALAVLTLAPLGCGVPNKEFRAQVVRAEALEARASDLQARLTREEAHRAQLEEDLAGARRQGADLGQRLAGAKARGGEASSGLDACLGRELSLRADLDVCAKARGAAEAAEAATRKGAETDQKAWTVDRRDLEDAIETCRGRVADRDAQLALLASERHRAEQEKREKIDEMEKTYGGLLEGLKQEVEAGRVTIRNLEGRLSVNLLDEILFDSGSADVKTQGRQVLQRLAEAIRGIGDRDVVIEGHTDAVPIRGGLAARFPTNWELSAARATSVVRYLEREGHIPGERLSAVGFGPYRPLESNDTPEGRAHNRRIEVKLVPRQAASPAEAPADPSDSVAPVQSPPGSGSKK